MLTARVRCPACKHTDTSPDFGAKHRQNVKGSDCTLDNVCAVDLAIYFDFFKESAIVMTIIWFLFWHTWERFVESLKD